MASDKPHSPNYKTVVLSHGKHSSPADGVCVMELASMIAEESFSDRPRAVCPVIAALLRAYNDAVDDRRRQDLYGCAARAVGTRDTGLIERERIRRIRDWTQEMRQERRLRLPPWRRDRRGDGCDPPAEVAASQAIRSFGRHTARTHAALLALFDELCALRSEPAVAEGPTPGMAVRDRGVVQPAR